MTKNGRRKAKPKKLGKTLDPLTRAVMEHTQDVRDDDLSAHVGYCKNSIGMWRSGKRTPSARAIVDLAEALGLEIKVEVACQP